MTKAYLISEFTKVQTGKPDFSDVISSASRRQFKVPNTRHKIRYERNKAKEKQRI